MDTWENEGGAVANPPKKKGTAAETELKRLLEGYGLRFVRTPASSTYDLTNVRAVEELEVEPIEVLATRPDRGQWLITMRVSDFASLLLGGELNADAKRAVHMEVKRYRRFSLHTIFENKFGRKS